MRKAEIDDEVWMKQTTADDVLTELTDANCSMGRCKSGQMKAMCSWSWELIPIYSFRTMFS